MPVVPIADRTTIQRWFSTHGVPNFIDGYARPGRVLTRAAWLAGAAALVAFVSALVLPDDPSVGVALIATAGAAVCGLGIGYVVVASGLVRLALFGLAWLGRTILHGGGRMLAVLPLLLVGVTFLFLGAETWQSIGRLHGLPLLLTTLLFVGLGVAFVSRQVRPDLDAAITFDDPASLRSALPRDLTWPDELVTRTAADDNADDNDAAELNRGERMNLRAVTTIAQLTVAVAVGLAIFAFFLVFGVLVVGLDTAKAWSTATPDIWWQATFAGRHYVLTSAHARVSGFLGVFSAFYFVVSASTDTALRATLTEGAEDHVQTCLAVRAVYRQLGVGDSSGATTPNRPTGPG